MSAGLGIIVAGAIGGWSNAQGSRVRRGFGNIVANITIEERHTDTLIITDHPVERGAVIADHAYKAPSEVTLRVAWSNSQVPQSPSGASALGTGIASAVADKITGAVQSQITGAAAKAIGGSALGNLGVARLGDAISNPLISLNIFSSNNQGRGTTRVRDIYQSLLDMQASAVPFDVYTGKRTYKDMLMQSISTETDITSENSLVCLIVCRQVQIVNTSIIIVATDGSNQLVPSSTAAVVDAGTRQAIEVTPDAGSVLGKAVDGAFTSPARAGVAYFN